MQMLDEKTESKTPLVLDDGHIETIAEYREPEELYEELVTRVRKYHPSDDISLIERAYDVAAKAHEGQVRKSGEPYIIHPLCVGILLAELEMDQETIAAGLLHDVVEDTIFTVEQLKDEFGEDVALLVDGVTKLGQLQYEGDKIELQAENLRKMFLAMAKDIRVIIIKLCDRLHNMRTLKHMSVEKQQEKARETMDIYAPIAQRLGIMRVKVELDDLSLKYLEPDVYYDLAEKIAIRKSEREKYVQEIVEEVGEDIKNAGIVAKIDGRVKHFFSIYKKMQNQNKTIDQIYDLFAIRIIVSSVKDCYAALGEIHKMYKPIPGRFKDYIAMPKANMYQSLHTTVIGSSGQPFEIQIRTYEMHKTAEYGIAAHWKYKRISNGEKVSGNSATEEEKLSWLKQILEWQQDTSDNKQYLKLLKSDLELFSDSVYCFTPTGDVKNLPAGSTPIDFAYAIHSAVGNKMIGARVNGKLVTIDYQIKNGDRIEIVTSQNSKGPSLDWLSVVKSTQARNKINQWFKNERKDENIIRGREMLLDYCKQKSINQVNIMRPEYMEAVMKKYGFKDWESVLAALGHGGLKEGQIVNKMVELYEKEHAKEISDAQVMKAVQESNQQASRQMHTHSLGSSRGIVVKGITDVSVRFSKCCSPVPGDEIVGFVTRGRGISIHRTDCKNMLSLPELERSRLIDAEWQEESLEGAGKYFVEITIHANNRSGLLVDISRILTERELDIRALNTRVSKQGIATMEIAFEISSKEQLQSIIDRLRAVESVLDIERKTS